MARDRESSKSHHHRPSKKSKKRSSREHDLPRGVRPLSEDDYFLRATEFRVWLVKTKDKYVEDLSTDEATTLFRSKFVKKWNRGALDRMYYDGIPESVLEQTKRTKHTWGFTKTLNDSERFALATARDSVGVATRKSDLLTSGKPSASEPSAHTSSSSSRRPDERPDDSKDARALHKRSSRRRDRSNSSDDEDEDDDRHHRRHHRDRVERKKHRKHHESVLDELVPKATGRDAMLEKRREVSSKVHGAARDREANRDGLDLSDAFLMGDSSGANDLQRRLQAREHARDRKQHEQQEKRAVLEAKESARMDKFLQDMGISATSKPITIAPRPK